ncbi:hypothetical protein P154DRAFT_576121 [Amniculicola lignicola CBS 123094]|uniref:Uncharacterized protein n=1 Tax=Amniculicola lignicola CBS 123094 TaxID=1392246 RepID=A0A6A5WHL3_9PLEO|nr:hypothetical protein P154DRAFT_576121 [Amniculicola lignicola CBS 123094]
MPSLTEPEFTNSWLDQQSQQHHPLSPSSIPPTNSKGYPLDTPLNISEDGAKHPAAPTSYRRITGSPVALGYLDRQPSHCRVRDYKDRGLVSSGSEFLKLEREEVSPTMVGTRRSNNATPASKGSTRTAGKRILANKKNETTMTLAKKRTSPNATEKLDRKSKVTKTNVGDVTQVLNLSEQEEPIDLTVDSDDDVPLILRRRETKAADQTLANMQKESSVPLPASATTPLQEHRDRIRPDINDDTLTRLKDEIERIKQDHAAECQRLDREKCEAAQKARDVEIRLTLELSNATVARDGAMRDLTAEQNRIKDVQQKCENLKIELETERNASTNLEQGRDSLKKQLVAEKRRVTELELQKEKVDDALVAEKENSAAAEALQKEFTNLKQSLIDEEQNHASTKTMLTKQIESLTEENQNLQAAATLFSTPPLSPNSSTIAGDDNLQTRIDNIRKTYITVKRRHDNLYSIAKDISVATRGWSPSFIGDLGVYLKQLRAILDEEGRQEGSKGNGNSVKGE